MSFLAVTPLRGAIALAVFAVSLACGAPSVPSSAASISAAELSQRLAAGDAPLVLDVRTSGEYAEGHLPGALNIPHDELKARLDELSVGRDEEIVVHCKSGGRAGRAERVLTDAGYTSVRDLDGHWMGWQEAGLPTE